MAILDKLLVVPAQLQLEYTHTVSFIAVAMPQGTTRIQWNPSIAAILGEQHFGRYIGVGFIEGLFCTQTVHLGPGCLAVISQLAFIQGWPLRGVPL